MRTPPPPRGGGAATPGPPGPRPHGPRRRRRRGRGDREPTRPPAAAAFAEVVRRIDFESVSATRLARLLQVLIDTFVDHERVQVLFSLLAGDAFRRAFDAALPTFPPAVAEVCTPLRAVHRRLLEDGGGTGSPELLAQGLKQVLSAPDPV